MFAHAAEDLVELVAGERVTFVPYALADWDDYAERVERCPGRARHRGRVRRTDPRRPTGRSWTRRSCWWAAATPSGCSTRSSGLGVVDGLAARVRGGRTRYIGSSAGTNVACPTIRTTNDMPICRPAILRGARPAAVPGQPALRRHRPGVDLHGRDPRRAHRGVPRGERLPGAGDVRGLLAAGRAASGPPCTARPGCSPATESTTCAPGDDVTPLLRASPTFDDGDRPRPGSGGHQRARVGTPVRLSGDLSLTHGPHGPSRSGRLL